MTRRERVGALCVLVMIAVIVFLMALVHTCASKPSPQEFTVDVSQFEQETDSAVHEKPAKQKKAKKEKKKSPKKTKEKGTKSSGDRNVEPVPSF